LSAGEPLFVQLQRPISFGQRANLVSWSRIVHARILLPAQPVVHAKIKLGWRTVRWLGSTGPITARNSRTHQRASWSRGRGYSRIRDDLEIPCAFLHQLLLQNAALRRWP